MSDLATFAVAGAGALGAGVLLLTTSRRDVVTFLTLFLALLMLIPSRLVIVGLGGLATPAMVVGLALGGWWLGARTVPSLGLSGGPQPIRVAVLLFAGWAVLAWGLAFRRPLATLELGGADRTLIAMATVIGVALITADGITTRERLQVLLRRLVILASVIAAIGMVQFFLGFDPVPYLRLPGLTFNLEAFGVGSRYIFNRPASTAGHPIEFGAVLALLLPIALWDALRPDLPDAQRWSRWASVLLLAGVVPLTISRSAILGFGLSVGVLLWGLPWRTRLNLAAAGLALLAAAEVAAPGLVATLRGLFRRAGAGTDRSIQARLDDVEAVRRYVAETPLLGRGLGTFSPEEYLLLDNQYFLTTIETGLPGLVLLFGMLLVAALTARRVRRSVGDPSEQLLAQALLGSMVGAAALLATFDGFSFRMFTGVLFVLFGIIGALWRLSRFDVTVAEPDDTREAGAPVASALEPVP